MSLTVQQAWPTPGAAEIEEAVRLLVQAFDPLKILVFGSVARGDAGPGSDLDLLVVLPHVENKRETQIAMRRVLGELPVGHDVVVTTPDEVEKRHDSTWHIVGLALQEGKTVYPIAAEHGSSE